MTTVSSRAGAGQQESNKDLGAKDSGRFNGYVGAMHKGTLAVVVVLLVAIARAEEKPWLKMREPAYPLKTKRTLVSGEEIARARENVARYPGAKKLADQIIKEA